MRNQAPVCNSRAVVCSYIETIATGIGGHNALVIVDMTPQLPVSGSGVGLTH